jgi:CheY-like chemotaxis protein
MMDGFETIKKIRGESRTASIPVIALTAYAMLENKEVIEKNGFDDLITKPVEFSLLSAKMKNILQSKSVK